MYIKDTTKCTQMVQVYLFLGLCFV